MALGTPIGHVDSLEGSVVAIRTDGTKVELKNGDPVYQGDTLETGADGAVGVVLADETTFSMADNGQIILDEMIYDPATSEGSIAFTAAKGVYTFVSGVIAKTDPDAMIVNTPVATIGIRGTQVGLSLPEGEELQAVLMRESDGFVGEIVVKNEGGVEIINTANMATTVTHLYQNPSALFNVSHSDILSLFGRSLSVLPVGVGTGNRYEESNDDEDLGEFETAAGGDETGGDNSPPSENGSLPYLQFCNDTSIVYCR
jgi:hypothetical protein